MPTMTPWWRGRPTIDGKTLAESVTAQTNESLRHEGRRHQRNQPCTCRNRYQSQAAQAGEHGFGVTRVDVQQQLRQTFVGGAGMKREFFENTKTEREFRRFYRRGLRGVAPLLLDKRRVAVSRTPFRVIRRIICARLWRENSGRSGYRIAPAYRGRSGFRGFPSSAISAAIGCCFELMIQSD
jgi:hypothetical protein